MEKDLTKGSIPRNIISFSLPYLLSYFLQTLYGMADLFIIGQFGKAAETTAVSVGSQVMHMLTVMIVGLAMGTTVTVARSIGGGKKKDASRYIGNTVTIFAAVAAVLTVVLLFCTDGIVDLMATPEEAKAGAADYLKVCFIGIPFITAYNVISSIFRGIGDTKSPMFFVAVACAVNIGLDILFMAPPLSMGPMGAALGTTLSQAVSVIIAFAVIRRQKGIFDLSAKDLLPKRKTVGTVLSVGLPIAAQDGLIQIAFIVITVIANKRGLCDAAAVGIVEKIIGFLFLVPSTMLSTVSALGAQNIGAGKPERAEAVLRYSVIITAAFGVIVSIVTQFTAASVVGLFTDEAAVATAGGEYFKGYVFDCILAGIHFSFSGYFCAVGRSGVSFFHNITAIILARIPGVWITSMMFKDTLFPMGLATVAGSLISVIICIVAFGIIKRNSKKQKALL